VSSDSTSAGSCGVLGLPSRIAGHPLARRRTAATRPTTAPYIIIGSPVTSLQRCAYSSQAKASSSALDYRLFLFRDSFHTPSYHHYRCNNTSSTRRLHASRPGRSAAAAASTTAGTSASTDDDEDADFDDEEVRRFAESSLAQLLADESEAFERFDSGRRSGGSRGGVTAAPPPTTGVDAWTTLSTEENQESVSSALPALERRQMAEILADFDPESPPPPDASLEDVQTWLECESQHESVLKTEKIINDARSRGDFSSLTAVQRQLLRWYHPLRNRIAEEQLSFLKGREEGTKQSNSGQNAYGPYLCALQAEKLAVIASHEATMLSVLRGGEAKLTNMAFKIGEAVEAEVHVQKLLRRRALEKARAIRDAQEEAEARGEDINGSPTSPDSAGTEHLQRSDEIKAEVDAVILNEASEGKTRMKKEMEEKEDAANIELSSDDPQTQKAIDEWMYGANHLNMFIEEMNRGDPMTRKTKLRVQHAKRRALKLLQSEEEWTSAERVKLGAFLINALLETATINLEGRPEDDFLDQTSGEPAFNYEKRWLDKKKNTGHICMNPRLYKLIIEDKFESVVGHTTRHQPMVVPPLDWTGPNEGGYIALNVDFMRTHGCQVQQEALQHADLSTVFDGLNVLGRIPWRIQKDMLNVAQKLWEDGIVIGEIPAKHDFVLPPKPIKPEMRKGVDYKDKESPGYKEAMLEYNAYRAASVKYNRIYQRNMDLRSLRCALLLKLNQAEKFKNFESIYFPCNIDFRGRAYPVPPHLSNVGSDLSRGLLTFKESKPLGPRGLYWLKVHLANFAGADKMSFDDRAKFVDKNMDHVRAAVADPFGNDKWWMELDDPLQGLSTCTEIVKAIDSGDPESYECSLPVHMDGSCNGLQHYAALGRDRVGAKAVNLCQFDEPQDVYIGVMEEVIRRVAEEAATTLTIDDSDPDKLTKAEKEKLKCNRAAKLVNGHIDRGVVKRTVMTSVYGVTFIGARKQIQEKIEEKLEGQGLDVDDIEHEIHSACGYLASVTMDVMGELFQGARQTMNWLATCARLISSEGQPVAWISPIGVPAVQPYRLKKPFTVLTLIQTIVLTNNSDSLPIHRQRQVTAFPPNYVHSLDSSHMLMTALEMDRRGLAFSAVHDSFWTHACDVDEMNEILRETFIDLYDRPLLEELKRSWELRYPTLEFPDIPKRGDLDINEVKKAPYFFQ